MTGKVGKWSGNDGSTTFDTNYSDELKYIWWSTGGAATRTVAEILKDHFDCHMGEQGGKAATHHVFIPKGKENYDIILNVRNPYSWVISSFNDLSIYNYNKKGVHLDFEEWIRERNGYSHDVAITDRWGDLDGEPNYFIKMEDILGSMKKIPCLQLKPFPDSVENNSTHKSDSTQTYRKYDKNGLRCDWKDYYTQELADLVYNQPEMNKMFKLAGYDKDSWQ
jgi:hypothetical protein